MKPSAAHVVTQLADLLSAVCPSSAEASRLLHDRRLKAIWNALAERSDASWRPVNGAGAARRYELNLETPCGSVVIDVASDDEGLACAAATKAQPLLQLLALDVIFERPLERLAAFGLAGSRVARVTSGAASASNGGWSALVRGSRELFRVAIRALPAEVAAALAGARARPPRRFLGALPVAGTIVVGERRLPIAVLRSLARADVLLLGLTADAPSLEAAAATLHVGSGPSRLRAKGRIAATTFTLLGGFFMTDHDPLRAPGGDPQAAALDALEVPVHFELETVSIAIADLESIEPGYVIELATPASQARLRLVACGAVIGEADLVSVAGQLGARITHLAAHHHDADQQRG